MNSLRQISESDSSYDYFHKMRADIVTNIVYV